MASCEMQHRLLKIRDNVCILNHFDTARQTTLRRTSSDHRRLRMQLERIAMDHDAEDGKCTISSNVALNLQTTGATQMTQHFTQEQLSGAKRLTTADKEQTLARLVEDQWLGVTKDNAQYFIGVRFDECAILVAMLAGYA